MPIEVTSNRIEVQDGYDWQVNSANPFAAPGELEILRQFVNTRDIEAGKDALDGPTATQRWFAEAGLWRSDEAAVSYSEVARVQQFREALRETLSANHDNDPLPANILDVLNETASRASLVWTIGADRRWSMTPSAGAAAGAMGRLVAVMSAAIAEGDWRRLKICGSDTCRWAFYDHSRAGTGKWCSMKLCGNRAKQEAFRNRNKEG
jgi:predicted RNA-binding Zn ribbon-like protein